MAKKDSLLIAGASVLIIAGWMVYQRMPQPQLAAYQGNDKNFTTTTASETASLIGSLYAVMVTYTNEGFSPQTVTIPKGSAVIFRNHSSKSMRIASNPHPAHDGYPEKNGCVGSTFDSCSDVPSSVSWSFTFGNSGSWGYHNHLNPSQGGRVIVQ